MQRNQESFPSLIFSHTFMKCRNEWICSKIHNTKAPTTESNFKK